MEARIYGPPTQDALVRAVAHQADLPVGQITVGGFPDGEREVRFHEALWGRSVALLASTGPPVDSGTMTLALMADAARRAGAGRVVAVVPYMGYSRGERLAEWGGPLAARLVADLLQAAGVTHLVALDLHSPAIAGFFTIPVREVSALELFADALRPEPDSVIVAPDAGATKRVSKLAALLGRPMAVAAKTRLGPDRPRILQICGEVADRDVIVCDDMISTGSTLEQVVGRLREHGARRIDVAATHAVMSDAAEERLRALGLRRVLVTDSLPYRPQAPWPGFEVLSIAPLLARAVIACLE